MEIRRNKNHAADLADCRPKMMKSLCGRNGMNRKKMQGSRNPEAAEPVSNNRMKNEGKGVVVIMPQAHEPLPGPMNEFDMVEKESDEDADDDEEETAEELPTQPVFNEVVPVLPKQNRPRRQPRTRDL
jgi:hypothetical protein